MNGNETNQKGETIRPADVYRRMKEDGTGSAVGFRLYPAVGQTPGYIQVTAANQNRNEGFDWNNSISALLFRDQISEILMVLRGMRDEAWGGKNYVIPTTEGVNTVSFKHKYDDVTGGAYVLTLHSTPNALRGERNVSFSFRIDEAFALMLVVEQSMLFICHGMPRV